MNYITFISIFIAVLAVVIQPLQGNPVLFCGTIIFLISMFIVGLFELRKQEQPIPVNPPLSHPYNERESSKKSKKYKTKKPKDKDVKRFFPYSINRIDYRDVLSPEDFAIFAQAIAKAHQFAKRYTEYVD